MNESVILSATKWSRRISLALVLAFLAACGDDESSFAPRDDESSSSIEEDSSSSVKGVILSGDSREGSSPSSSSSIASSNSAKSSSSKAPEPGEGSLMDTRDGQTYRTVTIGTQIWMAENLNYETVDSYCYNDSAEYCAKYGRLYTWAAAMDSAKTGCGYGSICSPTLPVQGICPMGWHLPNYDEWKTLVETVGGSNTAGKKLKSSSGWNDNHGASGNGTDAFGFAALPAGEKEDYGNYFSDGDIAYFWSSSIYGSDGAYSMTLFVSGNVYVVSTDKRTGYSVRCLKDDSNTSVTPQSSEGETSVSSSSAKSSSSVNAKSSSSLSSSSEYVPFDHSKAFDGTLWRAGAYKTFIDTRNGREYYYLEMEANGKSLKVMAENLNVGDMVRGYKDQQDDSKIERYCYDNDTTNCDRYGGLYQWAETMQLPSECNTKSCADLIKPNHQGICPNGWRLMTATDFEFIVKSNGNTYGVEGTRSTFGFGGYNTTGFSLVGAGYNWNHSFKRLNEVAFWHYPQEGTLGEETSLVGLQGTTSTTIGEQSTLKTHGFSVRCVMVETETE